MGSPILIGENIIKRYDDYTALDRVHLEVPKNSIFGLLGPNGAGKTTLMRIINQILAPDSGRLILNGKPLTRKDISKIGYLPEERGLYRKMKVGEQALYLAKLKGMSHYEATSRLKSWFKKLDILDWWHKRVEELSKGMAQKIQFVVTIIHEPELLIFDEPFSGFDPINAAIIRDEILEIQEKGTSIIFSTHRMESVEEICDYIALINNGKTILEGPIKKIKEDYKDNVFSVEIDAQELNLPEEFSVNKKKGREFDIKIQNNKDTNKLLRELNTQGRVISFKEKIPSMEDIFIEAVNK